MSFRLEMIIELLREAQTEKQRYEEYCKREREIWKTDDQNERNKLREALWRDFPTTPKKSVVNDNIKMARRLLLGEYL